MSDPELKLDLPVEAPLKEELRPRLQELKQSGVWIGTSSWKYPGWLGKIYSKSRYATRNKVSESKLKETCLAEYSEAFSTVCVDAAFYQYPTEEQVDGLAASVPREFKFAFKVTDHITIPVWPHNPRFLKEAGNPNPHFLSAETFRRRFLAPVERLDDQLGVMIFEFSPIQKQHVAGGKEFAERLSVFLQQLPKGFRYAVEVRNREFLCPEYFKALAENEVAHCFNSWNRMPSVAEQLQMPQIFTTSFVVARFLLKPGRNFQQAVELFKPYDKIREVYEEGRRAAKALLAKAKSEGLYVFAYFGNRFEGNSPETIRAVIKG